MNAIRNSYVLSRVAVWLQAGSHPSITIARARLEVDELTYRTSPDRHKMVSRHTSRVADVETIPVDGSVLKHLRCAMSRITESVRDDVYAQRDETTSKWVFQPRQDGWFALFDGKPNEVYAFHRWLCEMMS